MELWIRSQDKEKLLKVNDIAIEMNMIYGYFDKNTEYEHLGTYATKERALEVLDEIQKLIKPQMVLSKLGNPIAETCDGLVYTEPNEYKIKELSTYVYEMPEE